MDPTGRASRLSRARDALSANQFSDVKSLLADDHHLLADDRLLALQILAIADVHIAAAQSPSPSAIDQDQEYYYYYSILGIDKSIASDDDSIFFRYRLLAHLLDPQLSNDGDYLLPNATEALNLVTQAYRALSAPPVAAAEEATATTSKRKRPKPQARKTVRAIRFCLGTEANSEGHIDEDEEDEEARRLLRERRIAEEGEDVDDD